MKQTLKAVIGYFWRGCLVLGPVAATLYIAYWIIAAIDRLVPIGIPGLGFAVAIAVISLVGFMSMNVVGKAVLDVVENWFTRLPLAKIIYVSIRDLIQAFVGDKKRFNRPVIVSWPGTDAKLLGFVTRESLEMIGMPDDVAVYLPQSYNVAGNLVVLPRARVRALTVGSADLMTFIVSGGVSGLGIEQPGMKSEQPPASRGSGRTLFGIGPPRQ